MDWGHQWTVSRNTTDLKSLHDKKPAWKIWTRLICGFNKTVSHLFRVFGRSINRLSFKSYPFRNNYDILLGRLPGTYMHQTYVASPHHFRKMYSLTWNDPYVSSCVSDMLEWVYFGELNKGEQPQYNYCKINSKQLSEPASIHSQVCPSSIHPSIHSTV